jgi:hypothetical protein
VENDKVTPPAAGAREDGQRWTAEEIYRLRREMANCEHCVSLRAQIISLQNILPGPTLDYRDSLLRAINELARRGPLRRRKADELDPRTS